MNQAQLFVRRLSIVMGLVIVLLMPVYANAQTSDRISLLDNFGDYQRGESLFIFGQITNIQEGSFLILEIINPQGDLCQIQQLTPLPSGMFLTDAIPLDGRICGLDGDYQVKLFYGDYSANAQFSVSPSQYFEPTLDEYANSANQIISEKINSVDEKLGVGTTFLNRLELVIPNKDLSEYEQIYVDLWDEFFIEEDLFEINPIFRPAVTASLEAVEQMRENSEVSFEIAKSLDREIFSAMFYYEIGDSKQAIDILSDTFVNLQNANPEKSTVKRTPTFDELEDTLLNLMKKSDTVMSNSVKEEVAFIFARGTAPIFSENISDLVDVLSKSRYLDVISRKQSDLYRIIQLEWDALKPSLEKKESIDELLEPKERVDNLHKAALIVRELDNVERFISSDSTENSDLANLIQPDWNSLESDLSLAISVDDILKNESRVTTAKQVIDISSRLTKAIEISQTTGVNTALVGDWKIMLEQVDDAESLDEILSIVSEFDNVMTDLREKRNPLTILKFEYNSLKDKAELQADYRNLFLINNALQIIDTAEQMESGNPSITRIDRIEVLLTWASDMVPKIKSDLNSYDKDVLDVRKSEILQRAQSLDNLVESSLLTKRFLPGFVDFADSISNGIGKVRDLVIQNDLDAADRLIRDLFDEWVEVSKAYEDDPFGSDVGYSGDELQRIEYRESLDAYSNMVSAFYNTEFADHKAQYEKLTDDANELIEIGNFVDAEKKIDEIGKYLSEYLALSNDKIIYYINYDQENRKWVIQGAVDKPIFDRRENLYVTVYTMDGEKHSSLEFSNTKHGDFYTQWEAPAEPGLYVVSLQYQASKATQIVHIKEVYDTEYSPEDLDMVELARDFEELSSFMETFGGENYQDNSQITSVVGEIKSSLANKEAEIADEKLDELKRLIERYLPTRSRSAVIEAQYESDQLFVSGAVQKTLAFREDLFVDVFDQSGQLVTAISLKDNSSGLFNEVYSEPLDPGVYVAQLQYHDVIVTDFFNVV